jgi:carboxyl-terminal processing protease
MRKLILFILLISFFITSCKKKDVLPTYTTDEMARDELYDVMNQDYLWYNLMPAVVKEDYKTPYTLLEAMRYKALDRWSFIQTYEEFIAMYSGSFVGHGIRIGLDPSDQTRIVQIFSESDLFKKGVRRGWIIKNLNGTPLAPIFLSGDAAAYNSLIGPAQAGITNTFDFQTPEGKDSTITTTKSSIILNTVITADTLHLSTGVTGYLVFDQFIPPSNAELDTAFSFFRKSNITSLIVDLRYNGGGDLNVLTNMASYIAGSARINLPFINFTYNDKLLSENSTFKFRSVSAPVNVSKLVFITTRYTASASEDLINGLRPYFNANLVSIGDTTDGKPVGMNLIQYSNSYMFWPITFNVLNSEGHNDFFAGIAPQKYVTDDVTHDFGDKNEACLKEAIYYLENGSFSSKGGYIYRPSVQFSEKPEKYNNALILNGSLEFQR